MPDSRAKGRPVIGITLGDPAGIGPELVVKFFSAPHRPEGADFLVIGEPRYLLHESAHLHLPVDIELCGSGSRPTRKRGVIPVVAVDPRGRRAVNYREVSAAAGRAAANYIRTAVDLALSRTINAIVTCPIHKESLNLAGFHFPGHTELIAHWCGTPNVALMLLHGRLRIVHLSTHISLRDACRLVNRNRIVRTLILVQQAARELGIASPRIAVAALNPHAGEHGLFGKEEIHHIAPAIVEARNRGIQAFGPFPADSVFPQCVEGEYDFVLAMYHDQGHIPLKLLGFKWDRRARGWGRVRGVNVTLGLPIVRTSVDHGVAFDIVGQGIASIASLNDAARVAIQLVHSGKKE